MSQEQQKIKKKESYVFNQAMKKKAVIIEDRWKSRKVHDLDTFHRIHTIKISKVQSCNLLSDPCMEGILIFLMILMNLTLNRLQK